MASVRVGDKVNVAYFNASSIHQLHGKTSAIEPMKKNDCWWRDNAFPCEVIAVGYCGGATVGGHSYFAILSDRNSTSGEGKFCAPLAALQVKPKTRTREVTFWNLAESEKAARLLLDSKDPDKTVVHVGGVLYKVTEKA
jgi:hypothetical protein